MTTDRPVFGVTPPPTHAVRICKCRHVEGAHRPECLDVDRGWPCACDRFEHKRTEDRHSAVTVRFRR